MYIGVIWVHLSAAFVYRHEYRFNTRCRLRHDTHGAGGRNRQAGNVASAILLHVIVQAWASLFQAVNERVTGLAVNVENLKCTTLLGKVYR